jgi:NAD(P) transhydrogenase subunit beta
MGAAVLVTLMDMHVARFEYVLFGLLLGAAGGWALVKKAPEDAPVSTLALLNGAGGLASLLVALAQFYAHPEGQGWLGGLALWITATGGAIAFAGSLVVWARMTGRLDVTGLSLFRKWRYIYLALSAVIIVAGLLFAADTVAPEAQRYFVVFTLMAFVLGLALVVPDTSLQLPLSLCLLNAWSGAAAAASGLIFQNPLLIVAGALAGVGSLALRNAMLRTAAPNP